MSLVVGQNVTIISFNKKYKGMVYLYFHFVTHYITNYNHETYMIQKLYIRIPLSKQIIVQLLTLQLNTPNK